MSEIAPATRVGPADRTVAPPAPNSPNKAAASSNFLSFLRGPAQGPIWANGPVAGRLLRAHIETGSESQARAPHGLSRRRESSDPDDDGPGARSVHAALDPLLCQMALHSGITPPIGEIGGPAAPPSALPLREDLQNLINGLARRVAWGGDRRKGSARIELSEGPLAGATLIVHTEQRSVRVELELPEGSGLAADWQQRIQDRLEERGFSARVQVG
jgi:hypothetical protein